MMSRTAFASTLALLLALSSCKRDKPNRPEPIAPAPAPTARGVIVAGLRPAIRNAEVKGTGEAKVAVRLFLSRFTPIDGLRLALRFDEGERPDGGPPPPPLQYSWGRLERSLRFTITGPSGTPHVLEVASPAMSATTRAGDAQQLVIDETGLSHWGKVSRWKEKPEKLFAEPGQYSARIEGKVVMGGGEKAFAVELPQVKVVAVNPKFRSVLELTQIAAKRVRSELDLAISGALTDSALLAVDDVEEGRWLRFELGVVGYDVHYADVRISPGGQVIAMSDFVHFTCVAEGTNVATPSGDRPVEALEPGDAVWGYDVDGGRRVATTVVATRSGVRTSLVRIGGAETTPEHPIEVDGVFVPAGSVRAGARNHDVEGRPQLLPAPVPVAHITPVFDVEVGWPHTFFAGGVLVHNKAVAVPAAPEDPWRGLFVRSTDPPPVR